MNEVEKMYENAEVKKQIPKVCSNNEKFCEGCVAYDKGYIPRCRNAEYPPFTAEKQLEIIKLLCTKRYIDIRFTPEKEYYIFAYYIGCGFNKSFDEALAMFVNQYWQDLTEEERKQIKEILE